LTVDFSIFVYQKKYPAPWKFDYIKKKLPCLYKKNKIYWLRNFYDHIICVVAAMVVTVTTDRVPAMTTTKRRNPSRFIDFQLCEYSSKIHYNKVRHKSRTILRSPNIVYYYYVYHDYYYNYTHSLFRKVRLEKKIYKKRCLRSSSSTST